MEGYCIEKEQFRQLIIELGNITENYEPKNEILKILWNAKKIGGDS